MVEWELTATTVYCEAVDDEVTLLISADGTCRCTGHDKHRRPGKELARSMKQRGRRLGRTLDCPAEACAVIQRYRREVLGGEGPHVDR